MNDRVTLGIGVGWRVLSNESNSFFARSTNGLRLEIVRDREKTWTATLHIDDGQMIVSHGNGPIDAQSSFKSALPYPSNFRQQIEGFSTMPLPQIPLQPIAVPPGWTVVFNRFYDIDASDSTTEWFPESLFDVTKGSLSMSVDWLEKEQLFKLSVARLPSNSGDEIRSLKQFLSPHRSAVVAELERLLWDEL